jgi:hypothetical protein
MLNASIATPNSSDIKKERKRKSKDEPIATTAPAVADKKVSRAWFFRYSTDEQKKKKTKE